METYNDYLRKSKELENQEETIRKKMRELERQKFRLLLSKIEKLREILLKQK